jgi:hypothetical protein
MNDLIPVVLIALLCLGIGFALGSLVAGLRFGSPSKKVGRTQERHLDEAENPAQASPAKPIHLAAQVEFNRTQSETMQPIYIEPPIAPVSLRPSLNPVGILSRALQAEVQNERASTKSIAAQIDEILQEKLAGQTMEKRAIRLLELPGKGMVVAVGLEQYDGVGAVPDPEIRSLIREAVSDWERRASLGEAK